MTTVSPNEAALLLRHHPPVFHLMGNCVATLHFGRAKALNKRLAAPKFNVVAVDKAHRIGDCFGIVATNHRLTSNEMSVKSYGVSPIVSHSRPPPTAYAITIIAFCQFGSRLGTRKSYAGSASEGRPFHRLGGRDLVFPSRASIAVASTMYSDANFRSRSCVSESLIFSACHLHLAAWSRK